MVRLAPVVEENGVSFHRSISESYTDALIRVARDWPEWFAAATPEARRLAALHIIEPKDAS